MVCGGVGVVGGVSGADGIFCWWCNVVVVGCCDEGGDGGFCGCGDGSGGDGGGGGGGGNGSYGCWW